ncbi:MAG: S24/S26 family peptidase [Thermodesulfobacteriota bacterium]
MDRNKISLAAKELQLEKSGILGPVFFHGNSMVPFLIDGDELITMPVTWDEIKAGDIITYRLEYKFPTCRVIEKHRDKLVVKADDWPELFEVESGDVLGKVIERHRGGEALKAGDLSWILYSEYIVWRFRKDRLMSGIRYFKRAIRGIFKKG